MKQFYEMTIAGMDCKLPVCKLNEELCIAGFVIFGQPELTVACAGELLKKVPEYDVLITAESKGIPLVHEMARQNGDATYVVARKKTKLYMTDIHEVTVNSITTVGEQKLYISGDDVEKMRGKRVLIVDDVISTGESLSALEKLVESVDGNIVGSAAILAEGDAAKRDDIIFLEPLPLLDKEGNPLPL